MNVKLIGSLLAVSLIACPLLYIFVGPALDAGQMDTLKVLLWICGGSALYCFVVGELTRNNSQMDKLWSLLPIAYTWVIAFRAGLPVRLVVMASLATLWGARLTFNFARKGAYKLNFWEGEEDYRWKVLRAKKEFQPRWKWTLFNLFFICIYQNALVLMTTLPALVLMHVDKPFGWLDGIAAVLMLGFIVYETVADEQQWRFQSAKWRMLREGRKLEELPAPYNLGFNTLGLWAVSRHPNYFAEQATWCCFYLFSVAGGIGLVNWTLAGALLLVVLFLGSSAFAEEISSAKYPAYADYCRRVSKFLPGRRWVPSSVLLVPFLVLLTSACYKYYQPSDFVGGTWRSIKEDWTITVDGVTSKQVYDYGTSPTEESASLQILYTQFDVMTGSSARVRSYTLVYSDRFSPFYDGTSSRQPTQVNVTLRKGVFSGSGAAKWTIRSHKGNWMEIDYDSGTAEENGVQVRRTCRFVFVKQ